MFFSGISRHLLKLNPPLRKCLHRHTNGIQYDRERRTPFLHIFTGRDDAAPGPARGDCWGRGRLKRRPFLSVAPWHNVSMRPLALALCLLAAPALSFVAGCTSSANTPEATCLAHNVAPGTSSYSDCVEMWPAPWSRRHMHGGGVQ